MKYYFELIVDLLWWLLIIIVIAIFVGLVCGVATYTGDIDREIQGYIYFDHPYFCKYVLSPLLMIVGLLFTLVCVVLGFTIVSKLKEMRWS